MDDWDVDELFAAVRRAAPFAELEPQHLRRRARHAVGPLSVGRVRRSAAAPDLGSARRTRLTAREGAKRVAVINGGTIPDRGLYGVFLVGERGPGARVGELDEEMVFESRVGETFLLGASTWRIEEITHDRVLVSPAPGEPGKMPFWKADAARPAARARAATSASWSARCASCPPAGAIQRLVQHHDLDAAGRREPAALPRRSGRRRRRRPRRPHDPDRALPRRARRLAHLRALAVRRPHPRAVGDGGRRARRAPRPASTSRRCGPTTGSWCGFRRPKTPPDPQLMLPASDEVEALVLRQLGGTALFAAKFREAAGRALLLPKRRPGGRSPLWQQRKRAADLLAVAARFGSFPMLLEAYRECLRDVFDMPALVDDAAADREPRDQGGHRRFGDAVAVRVGAAVRLRRQLHLRRRRAAGRAARAGAVDRSGAAARAARRSGAARAARRRRAGRGRARSCSSSTTTHRARSVDGVHDLLLRLGDLTVDGDRGAQPDRRRSRPSPSWCGRGAPSRSASPASRGFVPVEYAGRYRDALGVPLPTGLPESLLQPVAECRRSIWRGATRARTGRSRPPSSPRATGSAARPPTRCSRSSPPAAGCSRESSGRAAPAASGAIRTCCSRSGAARWRSCARRSSRSSRRCSAGCSPLAGRGPAARRARRAARRDREPAGRAAAGVDLRERDPGGARRGLQPGRSRRADRRRRGGLVRRRAARRSRRPGRALPDRPLRAPAARAAAPAELVAARAGDRRAPRATRRVVLRRCTRRPAAAIRARPSTRCGIWCGRA